MVANLLTNATATGPGKVAGGLTQVRKRTITAHLAGTGAVSATVKIAVSNLDPAVFNSSLVTAVTFNLAGTTTAVDTAWIEATYEYWRAEVTAISGTAATVNVVVKET